MTRAWTATAAEHSGRRPTVYAGGVPDEDGTQPRSLAEEANDVLRAAPLGDRDELFDRGEAHSDGRGVNRGCRPAGYWLRKAPEQGTAEEQHGAGIPHLNGEGVETQECQRVRWVRLAAEQARLDPEDLPQQREALPRSAAGVR